MAVFVEIGHRDIDRGINGVAEGSRGWEFGGAVVEINEVLFAASVGDDIDVAILINIDELEAADAGGLSESGVLSEVSVAVVEKNCVGCVVVADGDVQITVVVEVCEFAGVGGSEILAERTNKVESGAALVEEEEVLLRPVSSVGDDDVKVRVAIKVAEAYGSRTVVLGPEV